MKTLYCLFLALANLVGVIAQNNVTSSPIGTAGVLTVTTTTETPTVISTDANVSVYWIKNSAGRLVNTMMYFGLNTNNDDADLIDWWSQIGSNWGNRDLLTTVDVITGATESGYGERTCSWGKNASVSSIPDGVYTVRMELADGIPDIGKSGYATVDYVFTKGPNHSVGTLSGSASKSFLNTTIDWVPVSTGLTKLDMSSLYSIYPNPAKSKVYVNGLDIQKIEILTLCGKSVLKTNQQTINLGSLSKGIYLVSISTPKGTVVKKLIKE